MIRLYLGIEAIASFQRAKVTNMHELKCKTPEVSPGRFVISNA